MARCILSICVGITAIAAVVGPVSAEGYSAHKSREYVRAAPIKNCTRINGRYGYYGNPWCTSAQQARWDRWSAQKR
jgi:hypothetical protein